MVPFNDVTLPPHRAVKEICSVSKPGEINDEHT